PSCPEEPRPPVLTPPPGSGANEAPPPEGGAPPAGAAIPAPPSGPRGPPGPALWTMHGSPMYTGSMHRRASDRRGDGRRRGPSARDAATMNEDDEEGEVGSWMR